MLEFNPPTRTTIKEKEVLTITIDPTGNKVTTMSSYLNKTYVQTYMNNPCCSLHRAAGPCRVADGLDRQIGGTCLLCVTTLKGTSANSHKT